MNMRIEDKNPTVFQTLLFIPHADVEVLRKALKADDEDTIINKICRRSNEQRQVVQNMYKIHYARDLIADIRSKTIGNFEKLLVALLTPTIEYLARELHDAIHNGFGLDETLIEILYPRSNAEIKAIKEAYEKLYEIDLQSELESDTLGLFARLLVSLCNANRNENGNVDQNAAMLDAKSLSKTSAKKFSIDETFNLYNMIFCQRNFAQIKLICETYHEITGHTLEHAIQKDFSGNIKDGMRAIVQCSVNRNEFFAHRLHKSPIGSTNDSQLIRLIVSRGEIDMQDIKDTFEKLYNKTLRSWIQSDTSGSYKKTLYILIGEEKTTRR